MKTQERVIYYDFLNIGACFCVVAMHCNWIVHRFENTIAWKQSLLVDVIAYWAVPVFFMLSGATLLEYRKKYSTKIFFEKRIVKTVIPFVIWNLIAFADQIRQGVINLEEFTVPQFVEMFFGTKFMGIYWFFIPLFMVYLSIPILSLFTTLSRKYLWYMLCAGLATYSIFPFIFNAFGMAYNYQIAFPMTGGYIVFVILGYLLSVTDIPQKVRYLIYLAGFIGAVSRYAGTYILSIASGEINTLFSEYINWSSVCLSVAVFVWFKYFKWEKFKLNKRIIKIVSEISGAGFGIYLLHMYIINFLCEKLNIAGYSWVWRVFGPVVVYIMALVIVKCIQKIPVVRKAVP